MENNTSCEQKETVNGTDVTMNGTDATINGTNATMNGTDDAANGTVATVNGISTNPMNCKREGYLVWDDYFMAIAFLSAQRSKDPSTQVGVCIVNAEKRIVGIGYNGMPTGCSDDILPWARESPDGFYETKYPYVCHAEMNAILNKNSADVRGCSMYVALFPCNECAKLTIQSGIKEVIFYSDKYHERVEMMASRRMFDLAGIKYWQHIPKDPKIVIDFEKIESNKPKETGLKKMGFTETAT